jgi:hypothetical protein
MTDDRLRKAEDLIRLLVHNHVILDFVCHGERVLSVEPTFNSHDLTPEQLDYILSLNPEVVHEREGEKCADVSSS